MSAARRKGRERLLVDKAALLEKNGEEFIAAVYMALTGRAPDADGASHYYRLLAQGQSKTDILVRIRMSKEGRKFGAKFDGFARYAARSILSRIPLVRRIVGIFEGIWRIQETQRELRAATHALVDAESRIKAMAALLKDYTEWEAQQDVRWVDYAKTVEALVGQQREMGQHSVGSTIATTGPAKRDWPPASSAQPEGGYPHMKAQYADTRAIELAALKTLVDRLAEVRAERVEA